MVDISTVNGIINQLITRGHHLVAVQDGSVSLRSKSSDKYLAAEHPKWGVATADREEIDDWEKFNVTTVHGWDTATPVEREMWRWRFWRELYNGDFDGMQWWFNGM